MKMKLLYIMPLLLASLVSAEEWSAPIGEKPFHPGTKKLPGIVSEKLDFGAYSNAGNLFVLIRNGKHKMGASTISIKCVDGPATVEVQRVLIAKPLPVIEKQKDGAHLLEAFTNSDKSYEIYYHVKGGKLESKVTVSSK